MMNLRKSLTLVVLVSMTCIVLGSHLLADEEAKKPKLDGVTCPVSGQPVDAAATEKYLGKDVYFCCENCPKAFKKDTKKFANKANHQLVLTGQAIQVACPLTGKGAKKGTGTDVAGVKVEFCCGNCKKAVNKLEGDEKLDKVFANLTKGFTVQTKCPVSGKAINPTAFTTYKDKKVYFCCEKCPVAFEKDPKKYEAKL